jgi:tetratricopeptide (TPR) repeat protein
MADHPRVEELRRRVRQDPASIAFAALAEEYRKLGRFADAVDTCRRGLARHPSYLSARVTLGRALAALDQHEAAAGEFEAVLRAAPENLLARKGLAEVFRRTGHFDAALEQLRLAAALAPQDPELRDGLRAAERILGRRHPQRTAPPPPGPVPAAVAEHVAASLAEPMTIAPADMKEAVEPHRDTPCLARQLRGLERFLAAIERARAVAPALSGCA